MLTDKKILKLKEKIVDVSKFDSNANLLKLLGDPTCLKILYILSREKDVCPSDLTNILHLSMPAISHQLSKLKQMGIVYPTRMGQMICYSFSDTKEANFIKKLIETTVL